MGFNKRVAGMAMELRMNPQELLRRLYQKNVTILKKQGAYIKTAMARSMRYAKPGKHAPPNEPPFAHRQSPENPRGPLLRKLIGYFVDKKLLSVITGPKKTTDVDPTVPQVLDRGGRVPVRMLKVLKFVVGKGGPIRRGADGKLHGVKLTTAAQLERANRLALEENALRAKGVRPYIKPRPFTAPLLTDGGENFRKLANNVPL